ncbi:MAG: RNA polymerase sigma factor [Prolixibacteraceae bacterium]|jgi:RNA polymerase sigma factor (sigma-70 family)|nr:RNA polymerase sigma factor [Prolixibacteraceae bacterium]
MSSQQKHIAETYIAEKHKLKGFVRKRVNTNEDAEDIVHDVFMSLTDGFDDILNLTSIISWIYSVARNKIIDFNRKKKTILIEDQLKGKRDEEEVLNLSDILPSLDTLPDEQMFNDLIWEQVQQCLELLPQNQKEVFVLHELEGYSFQQIAEITGKSVNTLLSRKRYAVLFLKEELEELFEIINT